MGFQQLSRLDAHLDRSELTPTQNQVLDRIALSINTKDPKAFRTSQATISKITNLSQATIARAIKALIAKGLIEITGERTPRQATLYAIALHCPPGCRKQAHYAKYEKRSSQAVATDKTPQGDTPDLAESSPRPSRVITQTPQGDSTYKELDTELNKELNTSESAEYLAANGVFVSLKEFEKIALAVANKTRSQQHQAIAENIEKAYPLAVKLISDKRETISNQKAWIRGTLERAPQEFLGLVPQTNEQVAKYLANALDNHHFESRGITKNFLADHQSPLMDQVKAQISQGKGARFDQVRDLVDEKLAALAVAE
jgi:DNA-binding Lrp family transcriptional regulator